MNWDETRPEKGGIIYYATADKDGARDSLIAQARAALPSGSVFEIREHPTKKAVVWYWCEGMDSLPPFEGEEVHESYTLLARIKLN